MKGFELTAAPDADVLDVAKAIVRIVGQIKHRKVAGKHANERNSFVPAAGRVALR